MSPATIAIVSVLIFVVLMIAVKIVVGKVLHDKDQSHQHGNKVSATDDSDTAQ